MKQLLFVFYYKYLNIVWIQHLNVIYFNSSLTITLNQRKLMTHPTDITWHIIFANAFHCTIPQPYIRVPTTIALVLGLLSTPFSQPLCPIYGIHIINLFPQQCWSRLRALSISYGSWAIGLEFRLQQTRARRDIVHTSVHYDLYAHLGVVGFVWNKIYCLSNRNQLLLSCAGLILFVTFLSIKFV